MEFRLLSQALLLSASFCFSAVAIAAEEPPTTPSLVQQIDSGRQHFNQGRYEDALAAWNIALDQYQSTDNKNGQARILQYKSDAYLAIGQYYKATTSLETALSLAESASNEQLAAEVAGSLGTAFLLTNRIDEARDLLNKAVSSEQAGERWGLAAVAGNNLGNLFASQGEFKSAIAAYRQAMSDAGKAGDSKLSVKSSANIARTLVDSGNEKEALNTLDNVMKQAESLSPSHEKAYVLMSVGRLYSRLAESSDASNTRLQKRAYHALKTAADIAESMKDNRAMSYAYGYLGELDEKAGRIDDAMLSTSKALSHLRTTPAPEIRYRWQWQEGRLLRAKGKTEQAISAYKRAVDNLQTIRPIIAAGSMGKQSNFREESGQLYLELADLLLKKSDSVTGTQAIESELREARNAVEMLKGAELENYFLDNCVAALKAKTTGIDQLGEHTAAIYPIILPDRLEILVSMPEGMKRYTVQVSAEDLNNEINRFRARLEKRTTHQYMRHAKKIYSWLIGPLEKDLQSQNVDTLVLIPDEGLRTIPLAALYDGKDFLIARYAIATTPGLTLTDPQPLPRENMKLLIAGLTEGVQGFPPLPDVAGEVTTLDTMYDSDILENSQFTQSNIEQELGDTPYSIVHVASHGKFQSDVRKTFLLTYDGKLNMDTLEGYMASTTYRDQPVELLTLSACQTAVGDDKAALGLGGIAVKAGARSALATLWYINDQASSKLITDFYANLKNPDTSKAKALRDAQLSMTKDPRFNHPSYWAPFLLIGNWL
ncbi:MAG: CHAT domain-containing protein [Gammaproteobacteria bacterium]|nr:CHAT domain-containing protein [Gammaproteobacteria bacterium]